MSSEPEGPLSSRDQSLEASLAGLRPRSSAVDRDGLFFEAGRQAGFKSATARRWVWTSSASAISALAAGVLVAILAPVTERVVMKEVFVPSSQNQPLEAIAVGKGPALEWGEPQRMSPSGNSENRSSQIAARTLRINSLIEELSQASLQANGISVLPNDSSAISALDVPSTPGFPSHLQLRDEMLSELTHGASVPSESSLAPSI